MKFGLKGHKEDARGRTLRLRDFLVPGLAYPVESDLTFGMEPDTDPLRNDQIGLCALAGPGHFERWEDQFFGRPIGVHGDDVEREYRAMVPDFDPDDPSTDTGLYSLDVFTRWRKVGLFGGRKIEAFANVDYWSAEALAKAKFLLGGVFYCFNLPNLVKGGESIFEADTWDVAADDGGVAGGHLVWDRNSWGMRKRITQAFVDRYCFDAKVAISATAIGPGGRAFSGLDLGGLREALSAVTA